MTHISPKDHFWTYQSELGQDWEYCDRCQKARKLGEKKFYTIRQATKIVEQEHQGEELVGKLAYIKNGHDYYEGHWGYIQEFIDDAYIVAGGTFGDAAPLLSRNEFIVDWGE